MKKYGKFLKRPEKAVKKQPKQKSAGDGYLQSYFSSLLSLVLCVSMFFGTSYAWFTSEVNNTGNEIYIGTLDVELEKQVDDGDDEDTDPDWKSLSETDAQGVNTTKLFNGQIRWEPGYTMLETVRVVNEGDLAFKYELCFTDGKFDGTAVSLEEAAEFFVVWSYYHETEDDIPNPAKYTDISEANGWTKVGTLAEVLAGKSVFTGEMDEDEVFNLANTERLNTAHTYTIALHMSETAGGENLKGQRISLNVRLVAYQMTYEEDAFGNAFDTVTAVSNAEDLVNALYTGANVVLTNDIDLGEDKQVIVPEGATATLELNGHTISQAKAQTKEYGMIVVKGALTITDNVGGGKITYADTTEYTANVNYVSNTISNIGGVLNILGGTIENTSSDSVMKYGYPHAIDAYQGSVTNIFGGTIKSKNYDAIRMFCNSETEATTVNISGGEIVNRVTFQNPHETNPGYGILNITGGKFTTTDNVDANVRLLNFSTNWTQMKATISGGTFDKGVKIQDNIPDVEPVMNDWLTVTGLELTQPTEGDVWKITDKLD